MKECTLYVTFLACLSLVGCGPSPEEIKAAETVVAAEIFATQTAEAPTPTSTPSPTAMPRPSMTSTPEIQTTATLPPVEDGWRTYGLEDFSISLPGSWIVMDINVEDLSEYMENHQRLDTDSYKMVSEMRDANKISELTLLWAINLDPDVLGGVSVSRIPFPMAMEADDVLDLLILKAEQMGFLVLS